MDIEEKTISSNDKFNKELTYIGAYDIIRRMFLSGKYDKQFLERLNNKCAADMNCEPIMLDAL